MREILNIAGGHELITGSFLGSWLTGSALGASIASKSNLNNLQKINLVFVLEPAGFSFSDAFFLPVFI